MAPHRVARIRSGLDGLDSVKGMNHEHEQHASSLNRLAARATTHCLTGCAIGEVLGPVSYTHLTLPTNREV